MGDSLTYVPFFFNAHFLTHIHEAKLNWQIWQKQTGAKNSSQIAEDERKIVL